MDQDYFRFASPKLGLESMRTIWPIRYRNRVGTCFAMQTEGIGQFWVTARHILVDGKAGDEIDIYIASSWKTISIQGVVHSAPDVDVSLFTIGIRVATAKPILNVDGPDLLFGQPAAILGYPFGWIQQTIADFPIPAPLWKMGTFAGFQVNPWGPVCLFDCQVNKGFSGGPAFTVDWRTQSTRAVGMLSSYVNESFEPVVDNNSKPIPNMFARANSGFARVVPIRSFRELADSLERFPN